MTRILARWKYLLFIQASLFLSGVMFGVGYAYVTNFHEITPKQISMLDILLNNSTVSLFMILMGLITGGMVTGLIMGINGYVVGVAAGGAVLHYGWGTVIQGLLPHFFPEIIGLLMCATVGSMSGVYILMALGKMPKASVRQILTDGSVLLLASFALFVVASFIEGNFSKVVI